VSRDSTSLEVPASLPAQLALPPATVSAFAHQVSSTPTSVWPAAPLDTEPSEVSAPSADPTALAAPAQLPLALPVSMDTLLTKLLESARSHLHAPMVSTTLNLPPPAPASAPLDTSSTRMCA
jgi:hypothetical protein